MNNYRVGQEDGPPSALHTLRDPEERLYQGRLLLQIAIGRPPGYSPALPDLEKLRRLLQLMPDSNYTLPGGSRWAKMLARV